MKAIHYKNLQRHLKTVHATDTPGSFAARTKIKMKTKQRLNKHKRLHENVVSSCDICAENFDSNKKRRWHQETIHNQVNLDYEGLDEIIQLRKILEQQMYFFKNRGQEKTLEEIKTILTNIKK